jgi:hypothetical protein
MAGAVAAATALLAATVGIGGYLGFCRIWPAKQCPRCDGTAEVPRMFGHLTKQCRRCTGTGAVWRWGTLLIRQMRRPPAEDPVTVDQSPQHAGEAR